MKYRVWKKCKRLSSCSQRSRGGRKAQRGCLMSVWVTTSKSFVLPGSSVPRHPADEAPVTSCKCWLEARSTNECERRIRGAERCWVLPTCREQPSHHSELGWFGTWAAELALPPAQLSCDPAKRGEGFSFQEPPEHTGIAPYRSCLDVGEYS